MAAQYPATDSACSGNGDEEDANDNNNEEVVWLSSSQLPRSAVLYYGTGHVLNDITSSCWFTYLLLFLTRIGLTPRLAAIVMLSGQLADGVATIFAGELIDRLGRYKLWHVGGSVLVAVSFSSVFGGCWICTLFGSNSILANTIAYSIFAAIFNIGWAATQVSHMSLINCLTSNSTSRVALVSCRNAFTMVANLCLYGIAYAFFWLLPSNTVKEVKAQYRWIALASVVCGSSFVIIFLTHVKEPRLKHLLCCNDSQKRSCLSWFRKVMYYQVALVFVLTRMTTNVSQALLAFYLIDDLGMRDESKALVPAVIYISSFLASVSLQETVWTGPRLKTFYIGGACLWALCGVVIFGLQSNLQSLMYIISIVIGFGNALMTVTSISMEGILVGQDLSSCGFVYASLGFLDKFMCGIALYIIENFQSTNNNEKCQNAGRHMSSVRLAMAIVPGGCAVLGALVTLKINLTSYSSIPDLTNPFLLSTNQLQTTVIAGTLDSESQSLSPSLGGRAWSGVIKIFKALRNPGSWFGHHMSRGVDSPRPPSTVTATLLS